MMRVSRCLAGTAIIALGLTLSACGSRSVLTPPEGASLPVAPYGATSLGPSAEQTGEQPGEAARPTAEQLLELDTLAAPERSVELRRRSEEREDDPFDLPPE